MSHYDVKETMYEQDGNLVVSRSQDVKSLIDANHELSLTAPSKHGDAAFRLAGRIPLVVAEQWSKECGAGVGTKAFNEYVKTKLLDGDFAKLRGKGF